MPFGICPFSVIPVRSMPSHRSELLSQLLFGELFEILETKGRQWYRVRCSNDHFVGWIEQAQCKLITPGEFEQYRDNFAYSLELVQAVMGPDHFIPVTMGARLPNFDGLHFRFGDLVYTFSGQALTTGDIRPGADFLLKIAKRYLSTPFLWGGRSPFGMDAPGFVQLIYQFAGIYLPREAEAQIDSGEVVDFIEKAQPGDLAFFENKAGKIVHVGMIMPENRIIHAFGAVRIDLLDHYGIFNLEQGRYTRRLRLIKRLLPSTGSPANSLLPESEPAYKQAELF
ncbi:MAG: C40 family peptidase [Haliscomenobacter sp.]|nr:C40 family peptidase [Haliscomenobacter sp.]MBK8880610.1 C40 family peptidase [Haliscomenobacter sp.]